MSGRCWPVVLDPHNVDHTALRSGGGGGGGDGLLLHAAAVVALVNQPHDGLTTAGAIALQPHLYTKVDILV